MYKKSQKTFLIFLLNSNSSLTKSVKAYKYSVFKIKISKYHIIFYGAQKKKRRITIIFTV